MESLRIDLRPKGIDVTVLAPGFVRTKPKKKKKNRRSYSSWRTLPPACTAPSSGATRTTLSPRAFSP